MVVDPAGNLYVANSGNNQVIEVPAGGSPVVLALTGMKQPTGLALSAPAPLAAQAGSPVTLTATVLANGPTAPTGTVTFSTGSTTLGSAALPVGGPAVATLTTSALPGGTDAVVATYSGDSIHSTDSGTTTVTESLTVTPGTLPAGANGSAYQATVAVQGGTGPYRYRLSAGTLPVGLTLNASTGQISGTPTGSGPSTFTVTVTDAASPVDTGTATYTIAIAVRVLPGTVPAATATGWWSTTFGATGGTAPYTYTTTGTLPPGLTWSGSVLSGTPTTPGTYTFTVTASDSSSPANTGSNTYTITVAPSPAVALPVTPGSGALPSGTNGSAYQTTVTASGGVAPYRYKISSGTLPVGLSLNAGTGQISGTPTGSGTSTFTVTATDAATYTDTGSATYSITIAVRVLPGTVPTGTVGSWWSATFGATGGTAPYTYTATGTVPPGLAWTSGNVLAGTPTAAGSYTFTLTATDSTGANSGSGTYTVVIAGH